MAEKPTTRGSHDLNNATTLRILGWSGDHRIEDADGAWVQIVAEKRHDGEFWTFARAVGGVLTCHTSLLSNADRRLRTSVDPADGQKWVMVIKVPPARRNDLKIEFDRP